MFAYTVDIDLQHTQTYSKYTSISKPQLQKNASRSVRQYHLLVLNTVSTDAEEAYTHVKGLAGTELMAQEVRIRLAVAIL